MDILKVDRIIVMAVAVETVAEIEVEAIDAVSARVDSKEKISEDTVVKAAETSSTVATKKQLATDNGKFLVTTSLATRGLIRDVAQDILQKVNKYKKRVAIGKYPS